MNHPFWRLEGLPFAQVSGFAQLMTRWAPVTSHLVVLTGGEHEKRRFWRRPLRHRDHGREQRSWGRKYKVYAPPAMHCSVYYRQTKIVALLSCFYPSLVSQVFFLESLSVFDWRCCWRQKQQLHHENSREIWAAKVQISFGCHLLSVCECLFCLWSRFVYDLEVTSEETFWRFVLDDFLKILRASKLTFLTSVSKGKITSCKS